MTCKDRKGADVEVAMMRRFLVGKDSIERSEGVLDLFASELADVAEESVLLEATDFVG